MVEQLDDVSVTMTQRMGRTVRCHTPEDRAEFERDLRLAAGPARVDVSRNHKRGGVYRNPHVEGRWHGWLMARDLAS